MNSCLTCGKKPKKALYTYCSNKCQQTYQYRQYIVRWKQGLVNGGEKCCLCGWNSKHPVNGRVPLEIDHLNGNAEDNTEENLRLICPNCHSLSSNFRNLNKGRGRLWRTLKYVKTNTI